ncbi:MAG: LTA synthase family protein [Clostridiaceae bacterium]|nr:LTA synthase family protein [Clostridiaceae bacterium]
MNSITSRFKDYFKSLSKDSYIKLGLFLIPLIGIVLKAILLLGYIQNKDPYNLDIGIAFSSSSSYLLYYFAFTLVFLSFALLFKGKGRVIYLTIMEIFFTALTLLDVMYFRGFLTVPSVMILTQTANLDNLGGSLESMLSKSDLIFFIDFIIFIIYAFVTRKSYNNNGKRAIKSFCLTLILPLLYIAYVPFNLYVLDNKDVKNAYLFDDYDPTNTEKYFSPIGYHIIDLYTVYKDSKPYTLTDDELAKIDSYYKWKNKNEDLPNNEYAGISKGKNLIYIQVESLENFVINKEVNGQEITPVLNKLVNDSLYFPHVYEQVNEGTSSDCDLMLNTSMLPVQRGSTFFRYPNTNFNSMPKILSNKGYDAISIHPDKGSFWNYKNALTGGIGFPKFNDYFTFDTTDQIGMGLSDKSYFEQVIPKLQELKSPFYAHTITLTNHGPFDLPDDLRKLNLNSELGDTELGGYFESVRYTDEQIGMFLQKLDEAGILDNSVVVITGDHTGVHKYYNSSIEKLSKTEDWWLDNGEPNVPLLIYDKSANVSKTFDNVYAGQIDIMPTVLYMLGVDKSEYENTALGRNLLNTNINCTITTNGKIRGNASDEDAIQLKNILELSGKMISANYFDK